MSFRSIRTSYLTQARNGNAYSRATGGEPLADKDLATGAPSALSKPMANELTRAAMHGVLVMGVMAGVNGQPLLSREVITAGMFAGAAVFAVDSLAPSWGAAARTGIIDQRLLGRLF